MKVVIVEDELAASENLIFHLKSLNPDIEVIQVLDTVKSAISFFSQPQEVVLAFMDIHLADGISFEIFDKVRIDIPVIFTTAYNQYALKAFKVNSIDYLLKPIDETELSKALEQFKVQSAKEPLFDDKMSGLLQLVKNQTKTYKSTYLVSHRDQLVPLKTVNIAYLYIDMGVVKAVSKDNRSFVMDDKLEDIENELSPDQFFRANRQFIVQKESIDHVNHYFNGKLIVNTVPISKERIVVSKAKAMEFKKWLDS
ncbi:LytTR family DNA-binding domain-containing protein [Flavobacteriaceae bacterium F89]|uniref:LytTR family DNA-binding domain-containing protein n=1 Tax=Cerina litoralis TaxID=2874477 RepID=A0AAE3EZ03_9FLAO|nr:LytTR family DNA-binding domain-containing protein [Cerina litoralis]MCG2462774.1 LytTR family DNA-binding domain-containing protein [Cerina litoralis]